MWTNSRTTLEKWRFPRGARSGGANFNENFLSQHFQVAKVGGRGRNSLSLVTDGINTLCGT
jgi:hypothetical protein